jgi:hypothetical protein
VRTCYSEWVENYRTRALRDGWVHDVYVSLEEEDNRVRAQLEEDLIVFCETCGCKLMDHTEDARCLWEPGGRFKSALVSGDQVRYALRLYRELTT